ncbi:single-stranded DNA-binding protein [Geodermatophilus marinus]|uniref:single-stranded DNA-binding protein n=1 Tax=Geodermatophilus sp. LHW52908 TaxID=2303986 RepID=UPI001314D557|nr:single-stranded DNA-binding protein [Geodermatophilus sp. LHW52908]
MNDTYVTVVGNVVDAPRRYRPDSGNPVTNFRMASTSRRYDNRSHEYVDGGTFWVDVECWNDLSGNVSGSISKGDPVIVHGALTTHSWEGDSGRRSVPRIKAFAVGPNLARGRADFTRTQRAARPGGEGGQEPEAEGQGAGGGPTGSDEIPVPGRDYVTADAALHRSDAPELAAEPAHV